MIAALLAALAALGVPFPAADDGPCPRAEPAIVAGDQYDAGVWTHADGRVFAIAPAEDTCMMPVR